MCCRLLLALALSLAVVTVCAAGIGTNRFTISTAGKGHPGDFLAVDEGDLTLGGSNFGAVSDNRDAADRWYIAGSKIKSSVGGGYLAYDPTGKNKRVFLSAKPTEGTDWYVGVGNRAQEGDRGVIRAMSGPLKGWYLDAAEAEEKQATAEGKTGPPRVLVLSEKPSRLLEAARIWEHK
jgi:hypothetical protein